MTQPQALPLKPGDIIVESIGPIVRLWEVSTNGNTLRRLGESRTFNGRRHYFPEAGGIAPAQRFTGARVFPRKPEDWTESARMVREFADALPWRTVHYYFASWGPSGMYWTLPRAEGDTGERYRSVAGCAEPVPEDCCKGCGNPHNAHAETCPRGGLG